MTTHTDLIARLRGYHICTVSNNEAADALEALEQQVATMKAVAHLEKVRAENAEQQVAALTKERDDLETECAVHAACTKLRVKQLAATQARESRLREALAGLREHSLCPDTMVRLLDTPTDDSALMERLKEERDRCALLLDNASGKGSIISCVSAAAAIRSMK